MEQLATLLKFHILAPVDSDTPQTALGSKPVPANCYFNTLFFYCNMNKKAYITENVHIKDCSRLFYLFELYFSSYVYTVDYRRILDLIFIYTFKLFFGACRFLKEILS